MIILTNQLWLSSTSKQRILHFLHGIAVQVKVQLSSSFQSPPRREGLTPPCQQSTYRDYGFSLAYDPARQTSDGLVLMILIIQILSGPPAACSI